MKKRTPAFLLSLSLFLSASTVSGQNDPLRLQHIPGPQIDFDDYGGLYPADFDSDGDYDILTFGATALGDGEYSYSPAMLWNDGNGGFTATGLTLGQFQGPPNSLELLDFNNDNHVDIAISADFSFTAMQTLLLRNNGDGSFQLTGGFQSIDTISPHVLYPADFDNDGDTDLLTMDYTRSQVKPVDFGYEGSVFTNDGNGTFQFSYSFPDFHQAVIVDFNKDGRPDIAKSFYEQDFFGVSMDNFILINKEGILEKDPELALSMGSLNTLMVLDLNLDRYPDIYARGLFGGYIETIHLNRQGADMDIDDAGIHPGLDGFLAEPRFFWGDFDLDGKHDFLITYDYQNDEMVIESYRLKDNGEYEKSCDPLTPSLIRPDRNLDIYSDYVTWLDLNGDRRPDCFFGLRDFTDSIAGHVFLNDAPVVAEDLPVPSGLNYYRDGNGIVLNWNSPSGFYGTFNVRVGSSPGLTDIVSPLSDTETGFHRIPGDGNSGYNEFFLLDTLAAGSYFWSVQSIDKNGNGGGWSEERNFIIGGIYVDFEADTVCLGNPTHFVNKSQTEGWIIDSVRWNLGDESEATLYEPEHAYNADGIYEVTVSLFSGTDEFSATREILVLPAPEAGFEMADHCLGDLVPILNQTADNGSGIRSWEWDFDDGTILSEQNPQNHGFVKAGTYNVQLTVHSANGCADSTVVVVNAMPVPSENLVVRGIPCVDEDFSLSTANNPSFSYQWKYEGGNIPGATGASYQPEIPGSYAVVISSACGEVSADYVLEEPSFSILAEGTPCKYSDYRLSVTDEPAFSYQWYQGGHAMEGASKSTIMPGEAGLYRVDVTTLCGIYSASYEVSILEGLPIPEITVIGPNVWILACSNDTANFYQWYLNGEPISGANEAVYIANQQTGKFEVVISDNESCFTRSDAVWLPLTAITTHPWKDMKIYPNPTSGMIHLEFTPFFEGDVSVELISLTGKKVYKTMIQTGGTFISEQILIENTPPGIYILTLTNSSSAFRYPIVFD